MKVNRWKGFTMMILICAVLIVGCQENNQSSSPSIDSNNNTSNQSSSSSASNSSSNSTSSSVAPVQAQETGANAASEQELTGIDFFIGDWEIWIPGGYATTDTKANGDGTTTVTQEYVAGAKGNGLAIQVDHTYIWETPTEVITGKWEETTNDRIVLLSGQYEFDWYVEKTGENEIKFYSFGMEEYGTRIQK